MMMTWARNMDASAGKNVQIVTERKLELKGATKDDIWRIVGTLN